MMATLEKVWRLYARTPRLPRQLASIARDAFGGGWELTHDVATGALPEDGRDTLRLQLRGGAAYAITATCDEDCSDIDLELVDPYGIVISRDSRSDDTPVVTARPSVDGSSVVRVIMVTCDREPCRYAVGVFGQ